MSVSLDTYGGAGANRFRHHRGCPCCCFYGGGGPREGVEDFFLSGCRSWWMIVLFFLFKAALRDWCGGVLMDFACYVGMRTGGAGDMGRLIFPVVSHRVEVWVELGEIRLLECWGS